MVTILLVEDDDRVRLLTKTQLSSRYQIMEASNGEEALEILEKEHIDLLIADIQMPKIDGYELVRILRDANDMTPVIMLTAMNTFYGTKLVRGTVRWKKIPLTNKEFELLFKLLSYPGVIFTKQQLMDEIWGYDSETEYDTIKTYISKLRNKFSECTEFDLICIRGLGYKVVFRYNMLQ